MTKKSIFTILAVMYTIVTVSATEPVAEDRAERAEEHRKLRLEYAASTDYNPYAPEIGNFRKRSMELLEKEDFDGALQEAAKGLSIDRLNIDLLMTQAAAYRAKGDLENAEQTRRTWISLVDSIVGYGDGKSFETAFQVISVDEEYIVMALLGLERVEQSLIEHDGSEFDVFTVRSRKSGNEFQLFFNIDIPKRWLNQHLFGKEKE
jgi:hypothetical protein